MIPQEAIERLKELSFMFEETPTGAIAEAIESLKKQIPKEPVHMINEKDTKIGNITFKAGTMGYKCQCGQYLRPFQKYCHECSLAQDWSKLSEKYNGSRN